MDIVYDSKTVRRHPRYRQARAAVLSRDTDCYLCGDYIDKTIPAGHWLAPEVDHVHPLKLGGHPWNLDNLALTHRLCNNIKHDMTLDQLGALGLSKIKKEVARERAEYIDYEIDFATAFDTEENEWAEEDEDEE